MYSLIKKKRDGIELSSEEIRDLIGGYMSGAVTDYQMAAFLMAVYFRGMSARETADLTAAMVASGDSADLSALPGVTVDKHSTGGVGDKTTLVLCPLLAAAGLTVAKMSGRGLGHTGGTLDKLESIPGFSTSMTTDAMIEQARRIGIAVAAQSSTLVPADGMLYALRDVTATVDSVPLIASSIMSKKLAAGARAIILDVKTGSGAFMSTPDQAFVLARALVEIGSAAGRLVEATVTSMDQPLGFAVGNGLEVREAIDTLSGRGPDDLKEVCLWLAGRLVALARGSAEAAALRRELEHLLSSGQAMERFRALVAAQGGDVRVVDDPVSVLPGARMNRDLAAPRSGFVSRVDALAVGEAARALGAGRQRKGDPIDYAAGVLLRVKVGTPLKEGAIWATVFGSDSAHLDAGASLLESALRMSQELPEPSPLIIGTVDGHLQETRF